MQKHEFYIKKTFELAKKGAGSVSPNPLVGSVIVKNNQIISCGYHAYYGAKHAELAAITHSTVSLEGATLYCNLEPCCHKNKKTPPCAQRIIDEKISTVVIANVDPNPLVHGKGIKLLKDAGIQVVTGVLQNEGKKLNEAFFTRMIKKRPLIHLKWAQSLDGSIATSTGESKWISNELSRNFVHQLRASYDAILVGQNTIIKDNPHLTVRVKGEPVQAKWRVILSSLKHMKKKLNIIDDDYTHKTIVFTSKQDCNAHQDIKKALNAKNIKVETIDILSNGHIDLEQMINSLLQYNISSILVEGGGSILTSFINLRLWDHISIFIAPLFIGEGIPALGDLHIQKITDAIKPSSPTYTFFDNVIKVSFSNSGV